MMRKGYAALILAAVLLLICSCGKTSGATSSGGVEAFSISEIVSEEGTFTDDWGYDCSYSYHVPQLDADTPDAVYINDVIKMTYGDIVAACDKSIEQKIMPDFASIEWESYQNGEIVSVVLKTITNYGYLEDYRVFNYNAEKGTQLLTSDILAIKSISEDTYYNALRRTAIQNFDDTNFGAFLEWGNEYSEFYLTKRGWTCSDKNIVDDTMAFLDANGDLAAIVKVGSLAEADYNEHIITLDPDEESAAKIEDNYFQSFSATLENKELTISLLGESGATSDSDHGSPYTVHGVYSDYTQVCCGVIGGMGDSFVFLLTDDGRVEFVDANTESNYGYFCVSGPILGVQNIVSLEKSMPNNGDETVVAVDSKGEKIDLAPFVQAYEQSISSDFLSDWTTYITYETDGGGSYEEFCSLEISGWDQAKLEMINFDVGTEFDYTGRFTFLGMSEAGSVYAYRFSDEDGRIVYEGAASFTREFSDYLYWKDLNGSGIFTAVAGEELILTETFG